MIWISNRWCVCFNFMYQRLFLKDYRKKSPVDKIQIVKCNLLTEHWCVFELVLIILTIISFIATQSSFSFSIDIVSRITWIKNLLIHNWNVFNMIHNSIIVNAVHQFFFFSSYHNNKIKDLNQLVGVLIISTLLSWKSWGSIDMNN